MRGGSGRYGGPQVCRAKGGRVHVRSAKGGRKCEERRAGTCVCRGVAEGRGAYVWGEGAGGCTCGADNGRCGCQSCTTRSPPPPPRAPPHGRTHNGVADAEAPALPRCPDSRCMSCSCGSEGRGMPSASAYTLPVNARVMATSSRWVRNAGGRMATASMTCRATVRLEGAGGGGRGS
jgi:hypothetical protein